MKLKRLILCVIVLGFISSCKTGPKDSTPKFWSWAKTPPMGWNSLDCYRPTVTEQEVKANADYMAEHLKQYGRFLPAVNRFPSTAPDYTG